MNKAERNLLSAIAVLLIVGGISRWGFSLSEPEISWEPTPSEEAIDQSAFATDELTLLPEADRGKQGEKRSISREKKRGSPVKKNIPLRQGEKININTANGAQLQRLPGVGPSLAERIIAYRREFGFFENPESLLKVKGIGKSRLDSLRLRVTFQE